MSSTIQNRIENVTNILQQDTTRIQNLPDFVISQEDYDTIESQADDLLGGSPAPIVVTKPNIFVQSTEPTSKDGIWIETNDYQMSNVTATDMLTFTNGSWNTTKMANTTDLPYSFHRGASVSIGADIYIFGGGGGATTAYKYNILTDTYASLTTIPFRFYFGSTASINTDVYLFGGSYAKTTAYKYDILTDTYTQLNDIPYNFTASGIAVIGTNIYLFGSASSGDYRKAYKYNIFTNSYTQLSDIPYNFAYGSVVSIGTDIYLLGGDFSKNTVYKYNTITNTYTQLTDIPYDFVEGSAVSLGTNIYLFGSKYDTRMTYEYDTLLDTYTQLTDTPYAFAYGATVIIDDGDCYEIYLLGGEQNPTKLQILELDTISFNNNNVIVLQDKPKYNTKLLSNGSNIESFFNNAWFYTTQDGLIKNIPTYYGNGTSWIKFKN